MTLGYNKTILMTMYTEKIKRHIFNMCNIDAIVNDMKDIFHSDYLYDEDDKTFRLKCYYDVAIDQIVKFYGLEIRNNFKAKLDKAMPMVCPKRGAFTAYKKADFGEPAFSEDGFYIETPTPALVQLYIPARARRSSAFSNKCRCDMAQVVKITRIDTKEEVSFAVSQWDSSFEYQVGSYVQPSQPFDTDRFVECGSGIHFFMTPEEAINYVM